MSTLVVLGHPDFGKSMANKTIINELKINGLDMEIRDIHQLYPDYQIDIQAEQAALLRHQHIVLQYPFYWYSMPAILKLWLDDVFQHQFAYGSKGDQLKGKNFIPSFTVGSSESSYTALGFQHFRVEEFCKQLEQTAYHTRMNYIDPLYSYGNSLAAGYSEDQIVRQAKKHAQKILKKLSALDKQALRMEV